MKYPEDILNRIHNSDCIQFVSLLPNTVLDGVLIDPPYGEGMGYDGDDNIECAASLLASFLRSVEPKTKRNGHLAIFWTMRNLDVCIDVLRSSGFMYRRTLSMYLPRGNARPYLGWLPRTQAIVVGQKYLPKQPTDFHKDMATYLSGALAASGLTKSSIAKYLGCDSRLVMKWTRVGDPAWCLPTPRFYRPLKQLLKLDDQFDILLDREPSNTANSRDDFEYKHDTYIVDNANDEMLHPSQKPLAVVEHIVSCIAPVGGVVFDGFSGCGTTAVACKRTGRNWIATDTSLEFCKIAQNRIERTYAIDKST